MPRDQTKLLQRLSDRELEVLRAFAEGRSPREVAAELFISLGTVQSHAKNIMAKLDVHSRLEAVVLALRLGAIELPEA